MTGTFCVSLFLLLLPTFTRQQTIGSCKEAGFSTCCTTSSSGMCSGLPSTCFCDVQCHTLRDCCNDIDETCPVSNLCLGEEEGNIRLGSISGNDTRLELCFDDLWGSLCVGDSWDDDDAIVACRELGYISGQAFVTDFGNVPVHDVRVECKSINDSVIDTSLANCLEFDDYDYGLYDSSGFENNYVLDQLDCTTHAGLICEGCNDGEIRLRDGYVAGNDKDGRVEICLNNTWGSLCSDSWDIEDASVACRQLGYSSENALPANFWPTFGTVHPQDVLVHCTGNETSLRECIGDGDGDGSGAPSFLPVGEVTCNSHAGVICEAPCRTAGFTSCCSDGSCFVSSEECSCNSNGCPTMGNCCPDILFVESCPEPPPVCNETDVRLMGGTDDSSGRVEICLLGQWGTVCDRLWDNIDAAVVCRQLGLESEGAFAVYDALFGRGDGTIFLDQVVCSGNESRLFNCRHRGVGVHATFCTPASDAGVVCPVTGMTACADGAVRLQDGATESSGRVEVCFSGLWGTVCDDFWDDRDAAVVCRQLGYNDTEIVAQASAGQTFPPGTGLIFLDNVDCTGNENGILECDHQPVGTSDCIHSQDAGVVCVPEFSGIGFEQPVYIFSEGTTDNAICIATNSTPLTGSVDITVQSEDISATVNSDYSGVSQQLTFTPGNTMQCIRIEIHGTDMQCEIEESFLLHIEIITGQIYAGVFRQNTTVIITDAGPLDTLYNFGSSAGDQQLLLQPNGQAPPLSLTQTFPFFGNNHSTIHVNPNGILSFERPVSEEPSPFPLPDVAAVAPFWEEVEYSGSDRIYYQESSQWCLLEKAYVQVQLTFPSVWNFFPTHIFTSTWLVSEPMVQNPGQNTFQAVLATDGEMSFVGLYYDMIEWGDRDGTIAGLNAGDGTTFEVPDTPSGSLAIDSNLGIPGAYVYRVDQFDVLQPFECNNGDLSVSELGLLEMCVNNTWTRICAEFLGEREAAVVCQQLGFSVGEEVAVFFSGVSEISPVLMNDVNCSGGESRLLDCLLPPIPLFAEGSCDYSIVSCTDIVVGLVQEEYTVSENDSVTVCAALNQTTSRRVVVRIATVETTTQNSDLSQARAGSDYNTTAVEFMFEARTPDQLLCVDIPIIDDDVYEQNEVMLIFLSTPDLAVQLDPQYAFIMILDNDVVMVELVTDNYLVSEEAASLSICVLKVGFAEVNINVMLTTMPRDDTTAEAGDDFPTASEIVTFSSESVVECRIVKVEDDNIAFEENEQFIVAVTSVQPNVLVGAINTANVTIIDNDQVLLQFSSSNYEVDEDNGTVTVCMTKDLETARAFTATATAREFESDFEAEEEDFVPATIPFVFPPGTVNTVCGEFEILSDDVALEGNEQFIVELSLPILMTVQDMEVLGFGSFITAANCTTGGDVVLSSALITIIDTDVVTVNFSSEVYEVNEGAGFVRVCLLKDIESDEDLLIHFEASELDSAEAIGDQDFATVSVNVSFDEDRSRGCIDVTIVDDSIAHEEDEQFMVQFTVLTPGVETGVPNISFVTIIDNDAPSQIGVIIGSSVAGILVPLFLILIIVMVIVFVIYHKKHKKYVPDDFELEERAGRNPYVILNRQHTMMSVASTHIAELPPEMLIPSTIIRLLDSIGEGEFGLVYKGEIVHPMNTEMVAVKTLKGFFDQNQINDMLKESLKMWKFNHPNVMTLIGVCIDGGPAPYIVMPLMANGSLLSHLKKERSKLILPPHSDSDEVFTTSKKLMDYCIQAAKGMEYLASQKFVHKDLAARNCMIDLHFVIKIADFGLSENIYDRNYIRHGKNEGYKLPIKWMAIESLTDLVFSEKTDVWAYGMTVWEVFSGGKIPYPAVDPVSLPSMIQSGYRAERPNNAACTDDMYSIMLECWKENPEDRPTFSQLVSSISSQLEGMAGYLDVGMLGDWQTSNGDTNESPVAEKTEEHND